MREAATDQRREIAALLRAQREEILARWEAAVRQLPRARDLPAPQLRDHVPGLLDRIALLVEAGETPGSANPDEEQQEHARHRLSLGFDAKQVVAELAVLRRIIVEVWAEHRPLEISIVLAIGRALDDAAVVSVDTFSRERDRVFSAIDRLSTATLESATVDELLDRLLRAVVESSGAIDTAAILLREGDRLRVRAALGLDRARELNLEVGIGEGFAGRIAAEKRSLTLRAAATDPLVRSPGIRERGVRALHGVPLLASGELIGVAHIGSLEAEEFPEWDRRIFAAMATRASAGIALHLAREAERARLAELHAKEAELRRAVREREEESARVEAIFEHAPVGIGFWDRDLRFVRANRRLGEIDGLPPEAHVGKRPSELLPGIEGIEELEVRWRETLESGRPETPREVAGETEAAPGVRRWFSENAYPVRVDGETLGLGAVIIEITDQKRAEQELAFLAQASRELADWVDWETTLDRITRLGVPRFADWCSLVLVDEVGAPRRVTLHGRDARGVEEARRIADEYPVDAGPLGLGAVLRDGTPRLIPSVADALRDSGGGGGLLELLPRLGIHSYLAAPLLARGRILGALAYGIASSRRRFDGRDLAFAGELARRCATAIDNARLFHDTRREAELRQRVLAVVSHDLRNPLSTILFSAGRVASLAAPGEPGEKLRRAADTIRRSAERMNRLIGDLLDVAAIQAGKLSVKPAPQSPAALLREVADAFQAVAREKGVALELTAAPDLPRVRADRDRALQALGNLVGNALKVTKAGRVALSAEPVGREVVLRVADTGPGIAPDVLPRLFEPYVRGSDAPYSGTGLGLSIAKGIAEAHGGRIGAESTPGEGSTFWLALPVAS